jgi:hypothetical protein
MPPATTAACPMCGTPGFDPFPDRDHTHLYCTTHCRVLKFAARGEP